MQYNYICDVIKFLLSCLAFFVFAVLVCGSIANQNYIIAILFAVLGVIYVYMAIQNISIIHIDNERVEKRTLGRTILSFRWEDIRDVGLVNKKFIYFSRDEMTDDDRNYMCFCWPPRDKIYFRAGKKAANTVELLWNKREKLFVEYKSKLFK